MKCSEMLSGMAFITKINLRPVYNQIISQSITNSINILNSLLSNKRMVLFDNQRLSMLNITAKHFINGEIKVNQISPINLKYIIYYFDSKELINPPLIEEIIKSLEILQYVDNNWHVAYLFPLVKLYLRNYKILSINNISLRSIRMIISSKIQYYSGKNIIINLLKEYRDDFYQNAGIEKIAQRISEKCGTINALSERYLINKDYANTSYIAFLLLNFFKVSKNNLNLLKEYMKSPNILQFAHADIQRIFSAENILLAETLKIDKNIITSFAFQEIGDPNIDSNWEINSNQLLDYQKDIKRAKEIISNYINSEIINFFFSKAAMDNDRKEFWQLYSKKMQKVWIVSQKYQLSIFDNSASEEAIKWLKNRYIDLKSNENEIALIMEINGYYIVEISTIGNACYIYSQNHFQYKNIAEMIKNRKVYSIGLLKFTAVETINQYMNRPTLEAGRLIHRPNWQNVFKITLRRYLGV